MEREGVDMESLLTYPRIYTYIDRDVNEDNEVAKGYIYRQGTLHI
jgi:hypothetical protein